MGREFTFANVRKFAQGYANYLLKDNSPANPKVIVSYDTRHLSKKFAQETARIFSLNDINTHIPNRDLPLAAISLAIVQNQLDGGVVFTASFNKPIYNGIKILNRQGAPALPSATALIEKSIEEIAPTYSFKPQYPKEELISGIHVRAAYIRYLEEVVDFDMIRQSGIKIVVDSLFGASRDYLDYALNKNNIEAETIHSFPYTDGGGVIPYCSGETLKDLSRLVKESKADIGLATDIDGDRFGIIDSKGKYIEANSVLPPLIEYLITVRKMAGGIVKSITSTDNIRRVADYYGRKVYVTPVGFKYLAHMLSLRDAFIAVESTNGAALKHTIMIKDGILFNLLACEMLAYYKMDMGSLLKKFYTRFPSLYSRESCLFKNQSRAGKYRQLLTQETFNFPGDSIKKIEYIDGIKFILNGSWLLIRESGTSNVFRVFAESPKLKDTNRLIKLGRSLIE